MKQYIVKALFAFVGKKRYKSGDVLSESVMSKEVAEDLVKRKFIVELIDEPKQPEAPKDPAGDGKNDLTVSRGTATNESDNTSNGNGDTGSEDNKGADVGNGATDTSKDNAGAGNTDTDNNQGGGGSDDDEGNDDEDGKGTEGIDAISTKRLRSELRAAGTKFSNSATKIELYAMWVDLKKKSNEEK